MIRAGQKQQVCPGRGHRTPQDPPASSPASVPPARCSSWVVGVGQARAGGQVGRRPDTLASCSQQWPLQVGLVTGAFLPPQQMSKELQGRGINKPWASSPWSCWSRALTVGLVGEGDWPGSQKPPGGRQSPLCMRPRVLWLLSTLKPAGPPYMGVQVGHCARGQKPSGQRPCLHQASF